MTIGQFPMKYDCRCGTTGGKRDDLKYGLVGEVPGRWKANIIEELLRAEEIDVVLVDEASQMKLPDALIAFSASKSHPQDAASPPNQSPVQPMIETTHFGLGPSSPEAYSTRGATLSSPVKTCRK